MLGLEFANENGLMNVAVKELVERINVIEERMRDPSSYIKVMSVEEYTDFINREQELRTALARRDEAFQDVCRMFLRQQQEFQYMDVLYAGYSEGE